MNVFMLHRVIESVPKFTNSSPPLDENLIEASLRSGFEIDALFGLREICQTGAHI
jgi:hypothetical protein